MYCPKLVSLVEVYSLFFMFSFKDKAWCIIAELDWWNWVLGYVMTKACYSLTLFLFFSCCSYVLFYNFQGLLPQWLGYVLVAFCFGNEKLLFFSSSFLSISVYLSVCVSIFSLVCSILIIVCVGEKCVVGIFTSFNYYAYKFGWCYFLSIWIVYRKWLKYPKTYVKANRYCMLIIILLNTILVIILLCFGCL